MTFSDRLRIPKPLEKKGVPKKQKKKNVEEEFNDNTDERFLSMAAINVLKKKKKKFVLISCVFFHSRFLSP